MKPAKCTTTWTVLPAFVVGLSACGAPSMEESSSVDESSPSGASADADSMAQEPSLDGEDESAATNDAKLPADTAKNDVTSDADDVAQPNGEEIPLEALNLTTCRGEPASHVTLIDADITGDQTWSGTVYVQGEISAASELAVTLEPGTQIVMAADSRLEFDAESGAVLIADGTEQEPIELCGEEAEAGFWNGLTVGTSADAESRLAHVSVSHAGGDASAALTLNGAVRVENVSVIEAGFDGVHASDFGEGSVGLTVEGSSGIALVLTADDALAHLPREAELSNNGDDAVHLRFDQLSADATLSPLGTAYLQEGDLKVNNGATLTVESGVDYRLAEDASLAIGVEGEQATVVLLGSEEQPISFSGEVSTSGSWGGIVVGSGTSSESLLSHVEIRHAGANASAALDVQASVAVEHVLVTESAGGVMIGASGLSVDSQDLTVTGTSSAGLTVAANALTSLPEVTLSGNGDDRIVVEAGAVASSGTVLNLGVPYFVSGDLETVEGSNIAIEAGTEFVMANDTRIVFGSDMSAVTVTAAGSAEAMIRFHGESQGEGSWYGIVVEGNVNAASSFEYVEIRDAGGSDSILGTGAALTLETEVNVENSVFAESSLGILKDAADDSDYVSANSFSNVGVDVATMVAGAP